MRQLMLLSAAALLLAGCTNRPEAMPEPEPPACLTGPDRDGDGVIDECDNCPDGENPDQVDSDLDGAGDRCDFDDDNDGVKDDEDSCPWVLQGPEPPDADGDGMGDECDPCPAGEDMVDSDDDGFDDCVDLCVNLASEANGDSDGDWVGDACDNCPDAPNAGQIDRDGDGIGDACDDDQPFMVEESTLAEIHEAIRNGDTTCSDIVEDYLNRIHRFDLEICP